MSNGMAKVALISELGAWSASTRFRLLQYVPRLEQLLGPIDLLLADDRPHRSPGKVGQARYFSSHALRYARRYRQLASELEQYDAVLVQRGCYAMGPGLLARPLERYLGRVVFDLDDAVFAAKPGLAAKSPAAQWLYGPHQARRILARADAVVVSTRELAQSLPLRSDEAIVLATVPDPAGYEQAVHLPGATVIGWAGTNAGLAYLDPLAEVFERLAPEGARACVVCSEPWKGPADFRLWRQEDEHSLFARFSIGIMPLPDTPYSRSKAGFKLLQYMAAGVPVVANSIGINATLVGESGAGFLADSTQQWETALRTLIGDPALRTRMGAAGRRFVQSYADLDGHAKTLAELLVPTNGR